MNEVLVQDEGHVRWIILNRPERMNAITGTMLAELNDALKAADDDTNVRVVLLTGEGRAFCSGLDLKQAASGEGIGGAGLASAGVRHLSTREICTVTLQRMDTPVIGVINGAAAGYGLDLALGCDMRLMSDNHARVRKNGCDPGERWNLVSAASARLGESLRDHHAR